MRALRTSALAGGAALALGAAVLLTGPAQAASGSGSSSPAEPVPAGATITWGGVIDVSTGDVPAGVTPAEPVPAGVDITSGGVVEVSGAELADLLSDGTATGTAIAKPAPAGSR